eukprot:8691162-Pyramimonas_sp.AAC.1
MSPPLKTPIPLLQSAGARCRCISKCTDSGAGWRREFRPTSETKAIAKRKGARGKGQSLAECILLVPSD